MQLVYNLEAVTSTRLTGQPEPAKIGEKGAGVLVQFPFWGQDECQERDDSLRFRGFEVEDRGTRQVVSNRGRRDGLTADPKKSGKENSRDSIMAKD
jgi:hypothetical protein